MSLMESPKTLEKHIAQFKQVVKDKKWGVVFLYGIVLLLPILVVAVSIQTALSPPQDSPQVETQNVVTDQNQNITIVNNGGNISINQENPGATSSLSATPSPFDMPFQILQPLSTTTKPQTFSF